MNRSVVQKKKNEYLAIIDIPSIFYHYLHAINFNTHINRIAAVWLNISKIQEKDYNSGFENLVRLNVTSSMKSFYKYRNRYVFLKPYLTLISKYNSKSHKILWEFQTKIRVFLFYL